MAMVFKKSHLKASKAFIAFIAIIWCVLMAIIIGFFFLQKKHDDLLIQNRLQTINNYMRSIPGSDSIKVSAAQELFVETKGNAFPDYVSITIFRPDGSVSISTAYGESAPSIRPDIKSSAFATARTYGVGFDTHSIDPVTHKSSYLAALYSSDGKYYVTTISRDNSFITSFLSYDFLIINIIIFIATIAIALYASHHARNTSSDIQALQHFTHSGLKSGAASPEFHSSRFKAIAHDIIQFRTLTVQSYEKKLSEQGKTIVLERQRLQSKRILAENLNHEIKTPIGIIRGYIETLITQPNISAELRNTFLEKCAASIHRLQNMAYNITLITRLEDGAQAIQTEDVNILESAQVVADDLRFVLADGGVTFTIDVPTDIYALSNSTIIYNLLGNLVKNACLHSRGTHITFRYIPTYINGISSNLSTKSQNADDLLYFEFFDDGTGVPPESVPYLFERFYRIENAGKISGGTGLGLAIVKQSVALSGGTISAENIPSGGLLFRFTLQKAPENLLNS